MPEIYLKKANKTPETGTSETRKIVERMLSEIENGKEEIVKKYALELDGFSGEVIISKVESARCISGVPTVSIFAVIIGMPVHCSFECRKVWVRFNETSLLEFIVDLFGLISTSE